MEFAVHFSQAAADLIDSGAIVTDRFKCPAWPDLIATVQARYPLYVHFPLQVGWGKQEAMDMETHEAADWRTIEALQSQTNTPYINVHLEPMTNDHVHIPVGATGPADRDYVTDCLLRDLRAVVARCGAERVIAENVPNADNCLCLAYHPDVIRQVIEEAGCGFLFDLSHARRAARALGMDARAYIAALPLDRTREIHLSGIQTFDDRWIARLRDAGLDDAMIAPSPVAGKTICRWLTRIGPSRCGRWGRYGAVYGAHRGSSLSSTAASALSGKPSPTLTPFAHKFPASTR